MTPGLHEEQQLRRYLLGDLSPDEASSLEVRYFSDDQAFGELLAAEDDLIDDYARGALSPPERAYVRELLRSSERLRRSAQQARSLTPLTAEIGWQATAGAAASRPSARPWLLAAASLLAVVVAGAGWRLLVRPGVRPAPPRLTAAPAPVTPPQAVAPRAPTVVAVVLTRPVRGAGQKNQLLLRRGVETVELVALVDDGDYLAYRGSVASSSGKRVWQSGLVSSRPAGDAARLTLRLPASALSDGDYTLTVVGRTDNGRFEEVADYPLHVVRGR